MKIWIVKSIQEDPDFEMVERAFLTEEAANNYAKQLDKEHSEKPQFVNPEFEKAFDNVVGSIPNWDPYTGERGNMDDWFAYYDEQYAKETKFIIDEMYKRGFFITEQMVREYDVYLDYSQYTWLPCEVVQITLEEE